MPEITKITKYLPVCKMFNIQAKICNVEDNLKKKKKPQNIISKHTK